MAHYAFIDPATMLVAEVIVGVDETETVGAISGTEGWEAFYETQRPGLICRRTSYHGSIRRNYAGIGYTWDEDRDAFIPPQPFPSWTLDETTCSWQPPFPPPATGGPWEWDETDQSWTGPEEPA